MDVNLLSFWRSRILSIHWRAAILFLTVLAGGGAIATVLLLRDPFDHSLAFGSHLTNYRHSHRQVPLRSNNVAVIVKTGATAAHSGRLATLLDTSLKAVDDPLIVSDLDQMIGQHRIHDVLARLPKDVKDNDRSFELYRKQHEYVESGNAKELGSLSKMPMPVNLGNEDKNAGWALDRFKFPRMVERAIEEQPDRDWYVFIEDDTYLSYNTLLKFLERYDPSKPLFIGSPVRMPGLHDSSDPFFFAYGGSGFILSRAVAKEWETHHYDLASHWDRELSNMWFGDYIFAQVLDEELGLHLTPAWPMMNNDEPAIIPFGREIWCQPAVTLHHMEAYLFDLVYQAERDLRHDVLRFRDVFHAANPSGLPRKRENWTNYAERRNRHEMSKEPPRGKDPKLNPPESAHESFESCEQACKKNKQCFMFSFVVDAPQPEFKEQAEVEMECYLSDIFRLGDPYKPRTVEYEDNDTNTTILYDRQWTSGWLTDQIDGFIEKHQHCRH